jgi:hypothetical protein
MQNNKRGLGKKHQKESRLRKSQILTFKKNSVSLFVFVINYSVGFVKRIKVNGVYIYIYTYIYDFI